MRFWQDLFRLGECRRWRLFRLSGQDERDDTAFVGLSSWDLKEGLEEEEEEKGKSFFFYLFI